MPFRCSCTSGFLFFCSNCFLFRNFQRVIVNTFKIFSCGYSEAIYLFCDNTQMGNVPKMDWFKITVYTYTHTYTWLALFFKLIFHILCLEKSQPSGKAVHKAKQEKYHFYYFCHEKKKKKSKVLEKTETESLQHLLIRNCQVGVHIVKAHRMNHYWAGQCISI